MHRHGYQGRKFHRERDQREALIKGLAQNLIEHSQIVTTLPKAKETLPYVEKLITKAKIGDLHNRRQILASLPSKSIAHKLVDEIAPKLKSRDSGYLRVEKLGVRRGDNAMTARLSFVDNISVEASATPTATSTAKVAKASTKVAKPVAKTAIKPRANTPAGQRAVKSKAIKSIRPLAQKSVKGKGAK